MQLLTHEPVAVILLEAEATLADSHGAGGSVVLVSEDVLPAFDQLLPFTDWQICPDGAVPHALISFLSPL